MDDHSSSLIPLRHSAAHIMAQAVMEILPGTKLGFGPAIDDGFYYDFQLPRALSPEDLPAIEARMREIIGGKHPFQHEELSIEAARTKFADQVFKLDQVQALARGEMGEHGESEAKPQTSVSTYTHDGFVDLCRGPHVANTGDVPADALKLLSIAGAYWRGSEKNPQLTRIYGQRKSVVKRSPREIRPRLTISTPDSQKQWLGRTAGREAPATRNVQTHRCKARESSNWS